MNETEKLFIDRPAFTAFPTKDNRLSDNEYLRLAVVLSTKCKINTNREERDDSYRIDLYFGETSIDGEYVDDLMHLIRASDMYTFTIIKSQPQTIRLTCYRLKRKQEE